MHATATCLPEGEIPDYEKRHMQAALIGAEPSNARTSLRNTEVARESAQKEFEDDWERKMEVLRSELAAARQDRDERVAEHQRMQ